MTISVELRLEKVCRGIEQIGDGGDWRQSTRMQEVTWMKVETAGVSLMLMMMVVEEKVGRCGFKEKRRRTKTDSAVCVFFLEVPIFLFLLFYSFFL